MNYTVSITKQGQISIPAPLRKAYGLEKFTKAVVYASTGGKIIVEPLVDLTSLRGVFKTKKKISSRKTRELFEQYLASRHVK